MLTLNVIAACQATNTSDVSIENKTRIYQAVNTSDIRIENKTCICQEGCGSRLTDTCLVIYADI
jgi:hypothetical protein